MPMVINPHRLEHLMKDPCLPPSPYELRRQGALFLIGGNLPVYETLETMISSFCQESTSLFHITFGAHNEFQQNLELVRQIKKHFNIPLMGRITYHPTDAHADLLYLSGLDLLDIPLRVRTGAAATGSNDRHSGHRFTSGIFPRWSTAASIQTNELEVNVLCDTFDQLLQNGVVPLLTMPAGDSQMQRNDMTTRFNHLAESWLRHNVPLRPLLPLIRVTTPLQPCETGNFIRNVLNRIHHRRRPSAAMLQHQLNSRLAEASFESSGL